MAGVTRASTVEVSISRLHFFLTAKQHPFVPDIQTGRHTRCTIDPTILSNTLSSKCRTLFGDTEGTSGSFIILSRANNVLEQYVCGVSNVIHC